MLSKHSMEIRSAKTWLDSDAQPEIYNRGVSGIWGTSPIQYLLKTEGWRTMPPAVAGMGVWGSSRQRSKILPVYFFGINNWILGLYLDKN